MTQKSEAKIYETFFYILLYDAMYTHNKLYTIH